MDLSKESTRCAECAHSYMVGVENLTCGLNPPIPLHNGTFWAQPRVNTDTKCSHFTAAEAKPETVLGAIKFTSISGAEYLYENENKLPPVSFRDPNADEGGEK